MKRNHIWTLLLCFVLICALLTGCGANASAEADYAMAETMAMESMDFSEGEITSGTSLSSYSDPTAKLIRTVRLDTQTQEYDKLMASLEEKISSLGGYIENRDAYNGSIHSDYSNRNCSMTIRIPADRLNAFITHVNEHSNVVNTNESVEDITLKYVDTASRVESLETEQDRLLELLEGAQNMTEILEIEARLSDVRYELESYASQLRVYDNLVDYATVHLYIDEVKKLTPTEEPTVWQRISEGFAETIDDVTEGAVDLFVWFIVNSPIIAIWAVVLAVVFVMVRTIRRKSKKKAAPAPQPPKDEDAQ